MLVEFQGNLFSFELLTFPCREMIKLTIHVTCLKNESIYIQKAHLLCDACTVYRPYRYSKTSNAFSHYATSHVSVLGHFSAELNEICCGSLLDSILKTYRRQFLKTWIFPTPPKLKWYLGENPKIEDGSHFHGDERWKFSLYFFIVIFLIYNEMSGLKNEQNSLSTTLPLYFVYHKD